MLAIQKWEVKTLLFLFFLFTIPFTIYSQESTVDIINADKLEFGEDSERGKIKKLIGRVILQESDVRLYADTAYIYEDSSDFEAFGNVKIKKADSLLITSEYLYFDKGDNLARLEGNVFLDNKEITLRSNKLFYHTKKKYGYYLSPGKLTHPDFTITSNQGYFYEETNSTTFYNTVKVKGEDYKLVGDTVHYNYKTKKTRFTGPTSIQTDSSTAFCHNGYFIPTKHEIYLEKNAWLYTNEYKIKGDSLWFNDSTQQGWAKKNVEWRDSSDLRIMYGENAIYNRNNQTTKITDNAIFANIVDLDTFYLASDTLLVFDTFLIEFDSIYAIAEIDTQQLGIDSFLYDTTLFLDTIKVDTIPSKAIKAHYDVKVLHPQLSGISDSMIYYIKDSTFRFFGNPIMWTDSSQLTGKTINIQFQNEAIHKLEVLGNSCMANMIFKDFFYNQIIGENIEGEFIKDTLREMTTSGNAESIYFIQDEQEKFVGVNKGKSEEILVRLKNNGISQVVLLKKPSAQFLPMSTINPKTLNFPRFTWEEKWKPNTFSDLSKKGRFHFNKRTSEKVISE